MGSLTCALARGWIGADNRGMAENTMLTKDYLEVSARVQELPKTHLAAHLHAARTVCRLLLISPARLTAVLRQGLPQGPPPRRLHVRHAGVRKPALPPRSGRYVERVRVIYQAVRLQA